MNNGTERPVVKAVPVPAPGRNPVPPRALLAGGSGANGAVILEQRTTNEGKKMQGPGGGQPQPTFQPPVQPVAAPAGGGGLRAIGLLVPVKIRTMRGNVKVHLQFGEEAVGREHEVFSALANAGWEVDEFAARQDFRGGGYGGGGGGGYGGGGYRGGRF